MRRRFTCSAAELEIATNRRQFLDRSWDCLYSLDMLPESWPCPYIAPRNVRSIVADLSVVRDSFRVHGQSVAFAPERLTVGEADIRNRVAVGADIGGLAHIT